MSGEDGRINSIDELEALYGQIGQASIVKEVDHIHPAYRPYIEKAPFAILATAGAKGLDASPRGDPAGFVHIEDPKTLFLPDRRGNNRIDSLRNIINDPRVGLLFLIPGVGETLRVNGTAAILTQPDLLARFAVDGHIPKSILRIDVSSFFFQCSRAVIRSGLWNAANHVQRGDLPSPGSVLKALSQSTIDGDAYDKALPKRLAETLY